MTCSETRKSIPELFGSSVFNDDVMQERLPKDVYKSLRKTIDEGKDLDLNVANAVANAMKDWAVEKGATHYTHWFQPLNGITAEKHDSFISPTSDGRVIMQFSSLSGVDAPRCGVQITPFAPSSASEGKSVM